MFGFIQDNTSLYSWTFNPGAIPGGNSGLATVNPLTTTSYTATATNALSGCFSTSAPVTVTVNPLPVEPTVTSPVTRCGPGSVTLTANGSGGTINWYNVSTGGTPLYSGAAYTTNVTANGTFWVAETSAAGCEGPRHR